MYMYAHSYIYIYIYIYIIVFVVLISMFVFGFICLIRTLLSTCSSSASKIERNKKRNRGSWCMCRASLNSKTTGICWKIYLDEQTVILVPLVQPFPYCQIEGHESCDAYPMILVPIKLARGSYVANKKKKTKL